MSPGLSMGMGRGVKRRSRRRRGRGKDGEQRGSVESSRLNGEGDVVRKRKNQEKGGRVSRKKENELRLELYLAVDGTRATSVSLAPLLPNVREGSRMSGGMSGAFISPEVLNTSLEEGN